MAISSDFNPLSSHIVSDIVESSKHKNDYDTLIDMFPSNTDEIDIIDLLSCDIDGSMYENITMPEYKLYYPEPFVASPSFVHEDLWFMHILHFQH